MKKRFVSLLLAISMVLTFLPVSAITAFAADSTQMSGSTNTGGYWTLTKNGTDATGADTYTIEISGTAPVGLPNSQLTSALSNSITKASVKDGVKGVSTSNILQSLTNLTYVSLPASINSIDTNAFKDCKNLTTVEIPLSNSQLKTIGEAAFQNCVSLKKINIPDTVTNIGTSAFDGCTSLTSITFANNSKLTSIESRAFKDCTSLTSIVIPNSVNSLGYGIFTNCVELKSITTSDGPRASRAGNIGSSLSPGCNKLEVIQLPNFFSDIYNSNYYGSLENLKEMEVFGGGTIQAGAFKNCAMLERVQSTYGFKSIGTNAFSGCSSLKDITLTNALTSIGENAFANCNGLISFEYTDTEENWKKLVSDGKIKDDLSDTTKYPNVTSKFAHTVTFNYGSDSGVTSPVTKYANYNTKVTAPTDPKNVKVYGWYTDSDFTKPFDFSTPITENITLYARTTPKKPTLTATADTDKHKVDTPVEINVEFNPGEYTNAELATCKAYLTFTDKNGDAKDAVSEVKLNNKALTEEQLNALTTTNGCSIAQLIGTGTTQSTTIPLAVTFNKAGTYNVKIELKNDTAVLCSDTASQIKVVEKEPATLDMTVAQGEHKINEPVKVKVSVTPNDYGREISNGQIVMTYDDDVASVELKGQELEDKSYNVPALAGAFEQEDTAMTATLDVTYTKSGTHKFTVEIKNGEDVLCSDTATIEIAKEEEKPTPDDPNKGNDKPSTEPEKPSTEPEKPETKLYALAVKNAEVTIADADGKAVETTKNEDGTLTAKVPEKAAVTVKYTAPTDAIVFDLWSITSDAKLDVNVKENPLTFTMPDKAVTIEAMTRDATIESDGPGVLGTAAMIGVSVAGTAVLGYQGYMIGTELYLKNVLPAGAAIPQNYGELAKLVWNDAGRPEPVALLAADATDEQKALTWAVENQLISADKAADASVTRWEVIQTWNKGQEMKG